MADKIKYQGTPFHHDPDDKENNDVAAVYDRWDSRWPGVVPLTKRADTAAGTTRERLAAWFDLFGDCSAPDFRHDQLEHVDLAPYRFEASQRSLVVHRLIADRVRWALQEIAALGSYVVRYIGGHQLRYKNNKTTAREIKTNTARYGAALSWYYKDHLKKAAVPAKPEEPWMSYCLVYDLHTRPNEVRWDLVSNHAFGTAIDVNPKENWLGENVWDMPPAIVRLFREVGFGWGGLYSEGKDAMHFEYELPFVSLRPPRPQFPRSAPKAPETPMRQYFFNEAGDGGFYPAGTMGNLHGGVHLPAGTSGAAIRAIGPGYVVAARLAEATADTAASAVRDFAGASTSFVLMRHEVQGYDDHHRPAGDPVPFFSLSMHLLPLVPDAAEIGGIPWLARVRDWRYGDVVLLDAKGATTPKVRALAAKADLVATEASVRADSGESTSAALMEGELRVGIVRPAAEDVAAAAKALFEGKVVTFHQPLLTVGLGEAVGAMTPGAAAATGAGARDDDEEEAGDDGGNTDVGVSESQNADGGGFLHWEVFAPAAADWVKALERMADRPGLFRPVKESSGKDDNYFEASELRDLLAPLLPEAERAAFTAALARGNYRRKLATLMQEETFFAPVRDKDDAKTEAPFTYPVRLDIDSPYFRNVPAPRGGPYKIEVSFTGSDVRGAIEIAEVKERYDFTVQVPAKATAMRLHCPTLHIDERFEVTARLEEDKAEAWKRFEALTAMRWRRTAVDHKTEWRLDGLVALLKTLKEKLPLTEAFDPETVKPLAWYARPPAKSDPLGEVALFAPAGAAAPTLFDGSPNGLPADGQLTHLHPVTLVWFLALLDVMGRGRWRSSWQLRRPADTKPFYWSFVATPGPHRRYFAVSATYAGVEDVSQTLWLVKGADPNGDVKVSVAGPVKNGVAWLPVDLSLWDKWSLRPADPAGSTPAAPGSLLTLDLPKPSLSPSFRYKQDKKAGGIYRMELHFPEHAPTHVEGLVRFRVWIEKNAVTRGHGEGEVLDLVQPVKGTCDPTNGKAVVAWDPGKAFGEILEAKKPPPGSKVLVRLEFWLVNGLDREAFSIEDEGDFNEVPNKLSDSGRALLEKEQDHALSTSVALLTLRPAGFGVGGHTLSVGRRGALLLTVRFPLQGDPAGWKQAKPIIRRPNEDPKDVDHLVVARNGIQRTFELTAADIGHSIALSVMATEGSAMFNGVNIEPAPQTYEPTISPALVAMRINARARELDIQIMTSTWPLNAPVRLSCAETGPSGTQHIRATWRYQKRLGNDGGAVDTEGYIRATVSRSPFLRGHRYVFTATAVAGAVEGRLGPAVVPPLTQIYGEGAP